MININIFNPFYIKRLLETKQVIGDKIIQQFFLRKYLFTFFVNLRSVKKLTTQIESLKTFTKFF